MAKFKVKTFNFLFISLISTKQIKLKKNNYHFFSGLSFSNIQDSQGGKGMRCNFFPIASQTVVLNRAT